MTDLAKLAIGDCLPDLHVAPISRATLALFAGGSGDHNPLHIDSDAATTAGFTDVFVHGMLSMALLGRLLTSHATTEKLRHWHVRFTSIMPVNAAVILRAKVVERKEIQTEERIVLAVAAQTVDGIETVSGRAEIAI